MQVFEDTRGTAMDTLAKRAAEMEAAAANASTSAAASSSRTRAAASAPPTSSRGPGIVPVNEPVRQELDDATAAMLVHPKESGLLSGHSSRQQLRAKGNKALSEHIAALYHACKGNGAVGERIFLANHNAEVRVVSQQQTGWQLHRARLRRNVVTTTTATS